MLKRLHKRKAIDGVVLQAEGDEKDFPKVLELGRQGKDKEIQIGEHLQEHQIMS